MNYIYTKVIQFPWRIVESSQTLQYTSFRMKIVFIFVSEAIYLLDVVAENVKSCWREIIIWALYLVHDSQCDLQLQQL